MADGNTNSHSGAISVHTTYQKEMLNSPMLCGDNTCLPFLECTGGVGSKTATNTHVLDHMCRKDTVVNYTLEVGSGWMTAFLVS